MNLKLKALNPLTEPNILLTNPPDFNHSLIKSLESSGFRVTSIPFIHISPAPTDTLMHIVASHSSPSWIILSSKYSVIFFASYIQQYYPNSKIAVIGKETANTAIQHHLPVHFIPSQFNSETFVREFLPLLLPGETILYPHSDKTSNYLTRTLSAASVFIVPFVLYQNQPTILSPEEKKTILETPWEYAIFTSSSAAESFARQINITEWNNKNVDHIAIGPSTCKTMQKLGFLLISMPQIATFDGIVQHIKKKSSYEQ